MTNTHAHDVMQMMTDSGNDYTRETFIQAVTEKFGPDARFCSCSNADMSPGALLEFLSDRGKLAGDLDDTFRVNTAAQCGHDHSPDHSPDHSSDHDHGSTPC